MDPTLMHQVLRWVIPTDLGLLNSGVDYTLVMDTLITTSGVGHTGPLGAYWQRIETQLLHPMRQSHRCAQLQNRFDFHTIHERSR